MIRLLETPRFLTLLVAALTTAMLWLALWTQMTAGMGSDLSFMDICRAVVAPTAPDWSLRTVFGSGAMWMVMMLAMMLPAMAPMISTYAMVSSKEEEGARLAMRVSLCAAGYAAIWGGFALLAAGAQLALRDSVWFTLDGTRAAPLAGGVLLIVAGAYEFTSIKEACLSKCRSPIAFLMAHWRPGMAGAFPIGLRHGVYCLGCCVALMGLMFVFGAMTLWWMALLTVYFAIEKTAPRADLWTRPFGTALIVAGLGVIVYSQI